MNRLNFFQRFLKGNENPESSVPTPEELGRLADLWRNYGHQNIQIVDDGIHVHISPRSHLHVQQNTVVFHGEHQHESFVAAIYHAQEAWGGRFAVNGSEDFKLQSWAYARAYGLTVTNYQPPADRIGEAQRLTAQIQARREAEARPVNQVPGSPPPTSSSGGAASEEQGEASPRPPSGPLGAVAGTSPRDPTGYVPPRNALTELLIKASPGVLAVMNRQLQDVRREIPTGDWPDVPYHYGMGRIKAYEDWLARLSEEERKQEITACRARYEMHYQSQAELLMSKMRDAGYEVNPLTQEVRLAPQRERTTDEQIRLQQIFENLGKPDPDRPRSRGRSRGREMGR